MHMDELFENAKRNTLRLEVEIFREYSQNTKDMSYGMYIGADNTSGCEYDVHNTSEVAELLIYYVENYGEEMLQAERS